MGANEKLQSLEDMLMGVTVMFQLNFFNVVHVAEYVHEFFSGFLTLYS